MGEMQTQMETEARETPAMAARLVERAGPVLRELGGRLRAVGRPIIHPC
ncbi:MAG TPA: hypothetical protein PLN33_10825 [Hyphomonadaceae bacterium]|nr:hypothetical protein [Hyphomonadaceae bacterium]HPN04670.1 hypothetical protein [Hyphomonadaceae bacterium]